MNCLILDDTQADLKVIHRYCQRSYLFDAVNAFEEPTQAIGYIEQNPVDVIFLDINMPKISGFELLTSLTTHSPAVIFITSDDSHAPKAFDYNAIDFLLKPVSFKRFLKAVEKVADFKASKKNLLQREEKASTIFLKVGTSYVKLVYDEILCVKAMGDYVLFITKDDELVVHSTMKKIQNKLPENKFIRVHRSYIVNKSHISEIQNHQMKVGGKEIPISNTYRDEVKMLLQPN